jgi:hypothetical protein
MISGKWTFAGLPLIIIIVATICALLGRLPDVNADPRGTGVVADYLFRTGSLTLDAETAAFFAKPDGGYSKQLAPGGGGMQYYFPVGPVLLAMPVVEAAKLIGVRPAQHDAALQYILVFVCILALLGIMYRFARAYFDAVTAAIICVAIFFGTFIGPTVSGAFWSIDCEILITGATILLLRDWRSDSHFAIGSVLGVLMFAGFLCRPTFAAFIACAWGYLLWRNRREFLAASLVPAVLLCLFIAASGRLWGTWLPPYYRASRLSFANFSTAASGLLFSPSRSILIYAPMLLCLMLLGAVKLEPRARAMAVMMVAVMLLQFCTNAMFPKWWAGYSFGPRISADLAFVGCLLVITLVGSMKERQRRWSQAAVACMLAVGFAINLSCFYDPYTRMWNAFPSVDLYPATIFDWRFPQFLSISRARVHLKCVTQAAELSLAPGACP